jgi:hypothetical protein
VTLFCQWLLEHKKNKDYPIDLMKIGIIVVLISCGMFISPAIAQMTSSCINSSGVNICLRQSLPIFTSHELRHRKFRLPGTVAAGYDAKWNLMFFILGDSLFNATGEFGGRYNPSKDERKPLIFRDNYLVIPWSTSPDKFFVFQYNMATRPGLKLPMVYRIWNISLNAGLGGFDDTGVVDLSYEPISDITCSFHQNKTDIWMLTRGQDSTTLFLIKNDSIIKKWTKRKLDSDFWGTGPARFSNKGDKLVTASHDKPNDDLTDKGSGTYKLCMYTFDRNTGHLLFEELIDSMNNGSTYVGYPNPNYDIIMSYYHNIVFSANDSVIYAASPMQGFRYRETKMMDDSFKLIK